MTSPWDDKQKPNEKSKDHGKKDAQHNEHEHGLGGKKPDKPDKAPKLRDLLVSSASVPVELINAAVAPDTDVLAGGFPSFYYQPNRPPILNQGDTPMCVAYSNAADQAHMDRPEGGKFYDFDERTFFVRIGGGPGGAYLTSGLDERKARGYPTPTGGPQYHKIAGYWQVDGTVAAVKAALTALPKNGGVIFLLPWHHSWFHPFASGKLPAPDYLVGYHAIWADGWNDNYGIQLQNSWGPLWGVGGRCYLPYARIASALQIFRTKDV